MEYLLPDNRGNRYNLFQRLNWPAGATGNPEVCGGRRASQCEVSKV